MKIHKTDWTSPTGSLRDDFIEGAKAARHNIPVYSDGDRRITRDMRLFLTLHPFSRSNKNQIKINRRRARLIAKIHKRDFSAFVDEMMSDICEVYKIPRRLFNA